MGGCASTAAVSGQGSARSRLPVPVSVITDSYKASHFMMYPEAKKMTAYGEFRRGFNKDKEDTRFVFYGIRYIITKYVGVQWTLADVERADDFYKTHNAGFSAYPFPKDLFLKFVKENDGYFPVKIEALPEGTVANAHIPVYQITAEGEYSRLITFLETILTQIWYPSTVATLSRRTHELIKKGFDESVDEESAWLLESRLHDFGFRGCTCVEQSMIGGASHLLSFSGTDTCSAAYYVQYELNNGKAVATSIPATEHSVMTSWRNEKAAIKNMIDKFGGDNTVFAVVMDSYNYQNALDKVLPSLAERHKKKGGLMVLRPDSGDPVECILQAMASGEKTFGAVTNKKGFKVLNSVNAIQGDGINYAVVDDILKAVHKAGYSAQNVAFGMGAGLLQKVNRDTMSFATKLNYIMYQDGKERLVMKKPATDGGKHSFPGVLRVARDKDGQLSLYPRAADAKDSDHADNELKVVYDCGKKIAHEWDDFDTVRARVNAQWDKCKKAHDPVSQEMKDLVAKWIADFGPSYEQMLADLDKEDAEEAAAQATPAAEEQKEAAKDESKEKDAADDKKDDNAKK
jgi:nicotinamide phosphoribosyltransferase